MTYFPGTPGNDFLSGTPDGDDMTGDAGNDTLQGGGGSDVLYGGTGNDVLLGGSGDDFLIAQLIGPDTGQDAGIDMLDGGDGFDRAGVDRSAARTDIHFSLADTTRRQVLDNGTSLIHVEAVSLQTGAGNDQLTGGVSGDVFASGAGNDTLDGGDGDDGLAGMAGDDVLIGGAGVDLLDGGDGNDRLFGGTGDTRIDGGAGRDIAELDFHDYTGDVVFSVADTLAGTTKIGGTEVRNIEQVVLRTGMGDDDLTGGSGDDVLASDGGFNVLRGGAGNDRLQGGRDTDILYGGTGNDLLSGGAGDDLLIAQMIDADAGKDSGIDIIDGGGGFDRAAVDRSLAKTDIRFSLADPSQYQVLDNGTGIVNVEAISLQTGRGHDHLTGGIVDDVFASGAGNDTLNGEGGNDGLFGMAGNDVLTGGEGIDVLDGGEGNDTIFGGTGDTLIDGGAGRDSGVLDFRDFTGSLRFSVADNLSGTVATGGADIRNLEQVTIHAGSGDADLTGGDANDLLTAQGGFNVLRGGNGNDTLQGGRDTDILSGGAGSDLMSGGDGNDILIGTLDGDALGKDAGADVIDGGAGFDIAAIDRSTAKTSIAFSIGDPSVVQVLDNGASVVNIEEISLKTGKGNDTVQGAWGKDVFYGGASNDWLMGWGGNDQLHGEAGNDLLDGGAGADQIDGGDGNDTIFGGTGDTLIDGGAGRDTGVLDFRDFTGSLRFSVADNLSRTVATGGADIRNLEQVTIHAGSGDADLTGGDANDLLTAQGGFNVLRGGNGNDTLQGGRDTDILSGGAGSDLMSGGDGNDILIGTLDGDALGKDAGADIIDGGAGFDIAAIDRSTAKTSIVFSIGDPSVVQVLDNGASVVNIEEISLKTGKGNDTVQGASGKDVFYGGAGDDWLMGWGGNDQLYGEKGNDLLDGGAGADQIDGGDGNDTLYGNTGDDSIDGGNGTDTAVFSGASTDYLVAATDSGFTVKDLRGTDGTDTLSSVEKLGFTDGTFTAQQLAARAGLPVAVADAVTTTENLSGQLNVLANDYDRDGGPLKLISVTSDDPDLTFGFNENGNVSVTPGSAHQGLAEGETATRTATYVIEDASGNRTSATIQITITGENDLPMAYGDQYSVDEDSSLMNLNVLGNDIDADAGSHLSIASLGLTGTLGSVTLNADNTVSYDPGAAFQFLSAGQTATDSFTYVTSDEHGAQSSATVTITIIGADEAPPSDVPVAHDDTLDIYSSQVTIKLHDLLANDEGAALTIVAASTRSANGALIEIAADGSVIYDPQTLYKTLKPGDSVTDTFDYQVADADGQMSTASVTLTISGDNIAVATLSAVEDQTTDNLYDLLNYFLTKEYGTIQDGWTIDTGHTLGTVTFDAGAHLLTYAADDPYFDAMLPYTQATTSLEYDVVDWRGQSHHGVVQFLIDGAEDLLPTHLVSNSLTDFDFMAG